MQRFDEVELEAVPLIEELAPPPPDSVHPDHAPRFRRLLALLIDLSLFVSLALALSPLLPPKIDPWTLAGVVGFVLLTSYYYFAGTWLLWGKTIGGAIFDVRVVAQSGSAMSVKSASVRWLAVLLSIVTAGLGFALAALPSRLSLADRLSQTRCIVAV